MPSSSLSPASDECARRVRTRRVPGHLNNAQLEELLFGSQSGSSSEQHIDEAHGASRHGSGSGSSGAARFPLNKQLVVFVVRDLLRLCCYMPEHVRVRIAEDGDSELRALTPAVGEALTDTHAAFRVLVARLALRLTGTALSPSAVAELVAAGKSIARASLTMDTRTRRTYLLELYVPGDDNVALSTAVMAHSAAFRDMQERSWFASGRNPLQQLHLTYPIQALQRVPRMRCPKCKRKSPRSHTDHALQKAHPMCEAAVSRHSALTRLCYLRVLCCVVLCVLLCCVDCVRVSWYCAEDLCAVLPANVPLPSVQLPVHFDM